MEHGQGENRTRRDYSVVAAILVAVIGVVGLVASPLRAVAPDNIISYQGRLLDTNGVPVADANVDVEFRFFDDVAGGTCLWSNSDDDCDANTPAATVARSVTLTDGLFSENLGDTTLGAPYAAIPSTVFGDNAGVYLEVEVEGETLAPRKRVVAAPYALNAQSLDGLDSTAFLSSTGDAGIGDYDFTGAVFSGASPFVFEGATGNAFESVFAVADPTDDRTITFQDASGTVALLTDIPAGSSLWEDNVFGTYEDDDDVIIGTAGDETVDAAGFSLSGDDLFVVGDIGLEGTLYSDIAVNVAGAILDTDSLTFGAGAAATIGDGVDVLTINSGGTLNIDDTNIVGTGDLIIDANGGMALNAIGANIVLASMGNQGVLIAPAAGSDTVTIGSNDADVDIIAIGSSTDVFGIDSQFFDVDNATGSITIDDDLDAGQINIEGTILNENSLTFDTAGPGQITTIGVSNLELEAGGGFVDYIGTSIRADSDFGISANNGGLNAGIYLRADDTISIGDGPETNTIMIGGNGIRYTSIGTVAGDGYTNINSGTGDINFFPTDDLFYTLNDGSQSVMVGGNSTVNTGVDYMDISTLVGGGFMEKYARMTVLDGAGAGDDFTADTFDLVANDADADLFGILVRADATANAGAGSYQSLLTLQNNEDTVGAVTDALLVEAGGIDGSVTDGVDVSNINITNAINLGQNFELMDGLRFFNNGVNFTFEDLAGNDMFTVNDMGATGNMNVTGTLTAADFSCTDCLDYGDFVDAMALDASTSVALDGAESYTFSSASTGDVVVNLTNVGDFSVQDGGSPFAVFDDTQGVSITSNKAAAPVLGVTANSLTTGNGLLLSMSSSVATSADVLTAVHQTSYTATTNVSGNVAEFARNLTADGAAVTLTLSGPVTKISNTVATANGGTVVDTTNLLLLDQTNASSTAPAVQLNTVATAAGAMEINSSATTGTIVSIEADALTTGRGLQVLTNNPTDDSGYAFYIDSAETTETADIVMIQTDYSAGNNNVFRIEADGEVFSDIGFSAGAFSTKYKDGEIEKTDGNLNLNISTGILGFTRNTTIGDGGDGLALNSNGTLFLDDTNLESTGAFIINSAIGQNLDIAPKQGGTLSLGNTNTAMTIEIGNGNGGNTIAVGSNNVASDTINIGTQNDTLNINTGEFDVAGATGAITIDDNGNAGSVTVEGSVLNMTSLTFVGAGTVASTGGANALALDSGSGLVYTVGGDNLAVGTNSLVASFSVTTATDKVRVGDGAGTNGNIDMYASDGDTGNIAYTTNDLWNFTGGNISHSGLGLAPTGVNGVSMGFASKSTFNAAPAGALADVGFKGGDFDADVQVSEAGGTDHNVFGVVGSASVSTAVGQSTRVVGVRGVGTNNSTDASAVQTLLAGLAGESINAAAATVPTARGVYGTATNTNAGGTITSASGVYGQILTGVGTITTGMGGYFENISAGTTRYGVVGTASGGANNYAGYFHSAGVQVATDVSPGTPTVATGAGDLYVESQLEIDGDSVTNTTIADVNSSALTTGIGLNVQRSTSGSDFTNTTSGLVNFTITDAGSTGTLMRLNHDGTGMAMFVDANGDTGNTVNGASGGAVHISNTGNADYGLTVHTDNAASDNPLVEFFSENTSFDDYVVEITANTGAGVSANGSALHIMQNDVDAPGANAVGTQALIIDTNFNAPAADNILSEAMILLRENVGGGADTRFRVDADGDVWADGNYGAGAADVAEKYPSTDVLTAGELVSFDPAGTGVLRSTSTYASGLTGIVSTSPGVLLGSEVDGFMIALSGRVPTNVTNENGSIEVGDPITSSSMAGVGMKATEAGTIVGYALEAFAGPGTGSISVFVSPSYYVGNVIGHDGLSTVVTDDVVVATLAEADAVTPGVDSSMLSLRGSGWDGVEAQEISMAFVTDVTNATDYRLSIKNTTGSEVAYISQAGDLALAGRFYPSDRGTLQTSKYIYYDGSAGMGGDFMRTNASGWATGSYDFAEMFPSTDELEPGDVVSFAQENESVRKSTTPYDLATAGIVSTRPGFLAGENREGDFPVALAGRVPTKVTLEGGDIAIGDPLATSSKEGYAMKATHAGPIVGYAMEPFDGSSEDDLIVAFVNVSYWSGDETSVLPGTENTASIVNNTYIQQSNANNLTALNMQGHIYMGGNSIVNIGRLAGVSDLWSVEEDGTVKTNATVKTVIQSYQGAEVETTAVTSPDVSITLVGTGVLQNGEAVITFEDVNPEFNDITSTSAPIRVIVTPNGPVSLYVTEKNHNGFGVRQVDGSDTGIEFDWMVTAYRKDFEPVEEPSDESTEETVVDDSVDESSTEVSVEELVEPTPESEPQNPTPDTIDASSSPDEIPAQTDDSTSGSTSEPIP